METNQMQSIGQYRDVDKLLELELKYKKEQLDAFNYRSYGKAPISTGQGFFYDSSMLPGYSFFDQFHDKKLLLETELAKAKWLRYNTIGRIASVRFDYFNFIPTMFGCEYRLRKEYVSGCGMPVVDKNLEDIVKEGIPSLDKGLFSKMKEFQEYLLENTPGYYRIESPSIASPFLQFSEIMGADNYTELYDRPELVHELLGIITDLTIETYEQLYRIMDFSKFDEFLYMGGYYNGIFMSGDPIIGISREMIEEFELPYIHRICEHFNCGVFYHYCDSPNCTRDSYTAHPFLTFLEDRDIRGYNGAHSGYFMHLDYYEKLKKNRFGIQSCLPGLSDSLTESEIKELLVRIHHDTYGKSGIHLIMRDINSFRVTEFVRDVWDML